MCSRARPFQHSCAGFSSVARGKHGCDVTAFSYGLQSLMSGSIANVYNQHMTQYSGLLSNSYLCPYAIGAHLPYHQNYAIVGQKCPDAKQAHRWLQGTYWQRFMLPTGKTDGRFLCSNDTQEDWKASRKRFQEAEFARLPRYEARPVVLRQLLDLKWQQVR